jgi:hypothetical protein
VRAFAVDAHLHWGGYAGAALGLVIAIVDARRRLRR